MRSSHKMAFALVSALLLAATPALAAQRVFVSSTQSSGDLGGLAGGDATCQGLADAQGLGGKWVAWLSTSTVDAIDRLQGDGPFVLVGSEEIVAASRAELTSGSLQNDIERTESGAQVPASVWTGTDVDGRAAANFCNGWVDSTNGYFGQTGASQQTDADWTDANQVFCNIETVRLYCFEQGGPVMAPVVSPAFLVVMAVVLLLAGIWKGRFNRGA